MTDLYDRATEREELERGLAIAAASRHTPLPYCGQGRRGARE